MPATSPRPLGFPEPEATPATSELFHINGSVFRIKYFATSATPAPPDGTMVLSDDAKGGVFWVMPARDYAITIAPCGPRPSA